MQATLSQQVSAPKTVEPLDLEEAANTEGEAQGAGQHPMVTPALRLLSDLADLKNGVMPQKQFYFLRSDAQEIHGLQDWPAAEWQQHMEAHAPSARRVIETLFGGGLNCDDFEAASHAIRRQLGEPMRHAQWEAVIAFQNEVLNYEHRQEKEAMLHYMSPQLLSRYLFDLHFPLGVEQRIIEERHRFALAHSGDHRQQHEDNYAVACGVYLLMLSGIGFALIFLISDL